MRKWLMTVLVATVAAAVWLAPSASAGWTWDDGSPIISLE